MGVIPFKLPDAWLKYNLREVLPNLLVAQFAIDSLNQMPVQKDWVERLNEMEFKREIAGTSRIEGAQFTDEELDDALNESYEELLTRSQRQARAAQSAYRWIEKIPNDRPIDLDLVLEIHRRMITNADDDHCPPGQLRQQDENVSFGHPRHRGVEGGDACRIAMDAFLNACNTEYKDHDPLIQALAAHYHIAAMHPFLDGNGRTARALESLLMKRAGLSDKCFVAMSNYYYEEKSTYLAKLAEVRENDHNLNEFLKFGLEAVTKKCAALSREVKKEISKAIYRNTMYDMFNRMVGPKKRVLGKRQLAILAELLDEGALDVDLLYDRVEIKYARLKHGEKAFIRDLQNLLALKAIDVDLEDHTRPTFFVRLEWPSKISENEFLQRLRNLPKAKTYPFLDSISKRR